jgi:hypothetical protein
MIATGNGLLRPWVCFHDVAHGVVEGQVEHLDLEVNGVAGEIALAESRTEANGVNFTPMY